VASHGDIHMNKTTAVVAEQRSRSMAAVTPIVFVVDDDISVRESLECLIEDAGWRPELFASAQDFLARPRPPCPSCLLLDIGLPDLNGLELQKRIAADRQMPIIFITGLGDIRTSVQAMKAGAVEFLTKPFVPDVLLTAIQDALERSRTSLDDEASLQALRTRLESLTRREREVMALVVRGQLNKQVGGELGISEITVKAHRGQVMRKMRARSLPELVNIATRLGLETAGGG
jgi:FixJ family two-component response regulator